MRAFLGSWVLGGWLLLAGCATLPEQTPLPLTGDPVVDGYAHIDKGPARDRVLWQYRVASLALRRGDYAEAKRLLDDSLLSLGGLLGKDREAAKSRGYFSAEARKTFVGEPYERVMAYYYRGMLYWRDGEPDNARACFRSAQLQDSDTENKEYASDYVLLDYLDGLATAKLAGDGSDAFRRATNFCHLAIPPSYNPRANVLVFLEYGQGPTKYATGQYHEELRFRLAQSRAREVMVRLDRQTAHVGPYDDLNFQATTRGGRVMDHVLANKAVFKRTTDTVGDAAMMSGAILAMDHHTDEVGLGLLLAGVASKILSAATTPQADTRAWQYLPTYLSFAALTAPPGRHTAIIEFLDAARKPLADLTKTIQFTVPEDGRDAVVFVSDQSTTPQNL